MSASDPGELYCPTCRRSFVTGTRCPACGTKDPFLDRRIDGRFRIVEKLGEGGMGSVYRGVQFNLGECAIKVIHPSLIGDAVAVERFMREAQIMADLGHPNLVAVRDFVEAPDGLRFLIMELVRGRDLQKILAAERRLTPDRIVRIGIQICDALVEAHARDIIHRDIKPANIMILTHSRDLVKILDFGLAKYLKRRDPAKTTNPTHLVGTPAYMPPELIEHHAIDTRGDLYSLGCVLYELATGRMPFDGVTVHEQLAHRVTSTPPPITEVPRGLAVVIERLLQRAPANRYHSAADTRLALEAALREARGFTETLIGLGGSADVDASTEPGLPAGLKSSAPGTWPSSHPLGLHLAPRPADDVEPTAPEPFHQLDSTISVGITEDGSIEPTRVAPRRKAPPLEGLIQIVWEPIEPSAQVEAQPLPPLPPPPRAPALPPYPLPRIALVIPVLIAIALVLAILALR